MAVTAKFSADFSSFIAAIDKAQVELADFGKGADTVQKKLNTMIDNFSGRKLIQEASLMTIAIEKAGGVSTLTAKELEQVGQKASDAADKLKKLGYDIPPGIQKIADAAKDASQATGGWIPLLRELGSSWVARIAEGILLRDAIRSVIGTIKDMASALPELALKGAAIADVEENFNRLTVQAGLLGSALLGALKTGTHNTITDFELMKTVNKDLAAGLNLTDKQFGTLAKGAFALAQATGTDVKTALDTMNDAMLTGRTRALALLTGKIDVTKAEEDFAKSLGKTAANLTEAGKLEASRVAILKAVGDATGRLGEQTDGLDEKVAQASTSWTNFTDNVGKAIAKSELLGIAIDGIQKLLTDAFGGTQQTAIESIGKAVNTAAMAMVDFGEAAVTAGGFIVKEFYAVYKVFGDVIQALELLNLGAAKLELLRLKSSDLLGMDPETQSRIKAVTADIADMGVSIRERGKALKEADAAQASIDATTGKLHDSLEALRAKMVATRDAAAAFVGPLQDEGAAHTGAGKAAGAHGDELTKLSAKEEAAIQKFKDATIEINAAGQGWRGTLDSIDGAVVESMRAYTAAGVSLDKLLTYYGLTATQGKAFTDMLKNEAEVLKLIDDATKEAATSTRNWFEATAKSTSAYVQEHQKAFIQAVDAARKAEDEIALLGVSGMMRQIKAIEQKEQAEVDALADLRRLYPKVYDELVAIVHQKYGLIKAEAIGATKDIIDVAHDLGLKTKDDLAGNLELAINNYKALRDSGVLSVGELEKAWVKLREAIDQTNNKAGTFGQTLKDGLDKLPTLLRDAFLGGGGLSGALKAWAVTLGTDFGKQLSDAIKKSVTLGGTVANAPTIKLAGTEGALAGVSAGVSDVSKKAAAASVAMAALGVTTGAIAAAAASTAGLTTAAVGGALALGAATAGIGLAALGVVLLVKHFTGLSASIKEARANVVKFEEAFGGVDQMIKTVGNAFAVLGLKGTDAEAALKRLWNTNAGAASVALAMKDIADKLAQAAAVTKILDGDFKDMLTAAVNFGEAFPASLTDSIQQLIDMGIVTGDNLALFNQLTGQTGVNFKKMQDIANKYGIDLASLGTKFQSARLHDSAQTIINDFDVLVRNGADVGAVLVGMSKNISSLVSDSLKFGTDIPENMKPWILELQRAGLLIDENGNQITDLSGLKFADPIVTEFQKIINKLQELIDKIAGTAGVTDALNKIPTDVNVGVHFNVDNPELPEIKQMAVGGQGRVTKPTLFYSAGNEDYAFSGEGKRFSDGGGVVGRGPIEVSMSFTFPPGTNVNDPQALALALQDVLRRDELGTMTAIEKKIDSRIAQAA